MVVKWLLWYFKWFPWYKLEFGVEIVAKWLLLAVSRWLVRCCYVVDLLPQMDTKGVLNGCCSILGSCQGVTINSL